MCVPRRIQVSMNTQTHYSHQAQIIRDHHVEYMSHCVFVCVCAVGCSASSLLQWSCREQVRVTTTTVPTVHSVLSRTQILCVSVSMVTRACTVRGWSASTSSIENRSCRSPPTSLQNRPIYLYRYMS